MSRTKDLIYSSLAKQTTRALERFLWIIQVDQRLVDIAGHNGFIFAYNFLQLMVHDLLRFKVKVFVMKMNVQHNHLYLMNFLYSARSWPSRL